MDVLTCFDDTVAAWFRSSFGEPTEIQRLSWPEIGSGKHVLLSAPTGSGKTLTAFLWALNQLITGGWEGGTVRVLYISPLKALNNDIRRNLITPLEQLQRIYSDNGKEIPPIRVHTRSGDTPSSERQKMVRRPPEIFITTPESLTIILSTKKSRNMFTGLRCVVLDEIHAVAGTKRGSYLMTGIERLVLLSGEFQRIALSATVHPREKIAAFFGGFRLIHGGDQIHYEKRQVKVIESKENKSYAISVAFPKLPTLPEGSGTDDGDVPTEESSVWRGLVSDLKEIIKRNRSTLIFTNTRRHAEKLTLLLNEGEDRELAYAHHGSLSREIRYIVERRMKQGELAAIVATSSLELGIDIGTLDEVVLVQSPPSVSSALQRIGRAGHSVGVTSKGTIFPLFGRDLVDAAVISKTAVEQEIEELIPIENPLDVLAQTVLSMTGVESWDCDELFRFICSVFPFHSLPKRQFDLVLEMLQGRYADSRIRDLQPRIDIDPVTQTITAKQHVLPILYHSGGTIPDRGNYTLREGRTKEKIGELDEEFVWERRVGESFPFGNKHWVITHIDSQYIDVVPSTRPYVTIPFWRAEPRNRDFHLSSRISSFLEENGPLVGTKPFNDKLATLFTMSSRAAEELNEFLQYQMEVTGTGLPHRHRIIIEEYRDPLNKTDTTQIILHTLWGGRINYPFSLAFSQGWEDTYGYPLQTFADNDCILFLLPHQFSPELIHTHFVTRPLVTTAMIEKLLRKKLESSSYFGARFRENSGRALLLPKSGFNRRMPLWFNRLRAKKLLESVKQYPDFPILTETWRSCLRDDFDLSNLAMLIEEIEEGETEVVHCKTTTPSPFSGNMIWQKTNLYMYQDDTPLPSGASNLSDEILKEAVFSSHLRPTLSRALIDEFQTKLQRCMPGYRPEQTGELLEWTTDRLLVPEVEWERLIEDIDPDTVAQAEENVVAVILPGAVTTCRASLSSLARISVVMDLSPLEMKAGPPLADDYGSTGGSGRARKIFDAARNRFASSIEEGDLNTDWREARLVAEFLRYYGPVPTSFLREVWGFTPQRLSSLFEVLNEENLIVIDHISEDAPSLQVCDAENLEHLLRLSRKKAKFEIEPLTPESLPLFFAERQGIIAAGRTAPAVTSAANTPDNGAVLSDVLEQFFGFPARAELWEREILPLRTGRYYPQWLDSLLASTDLLWLGMKGRKIFFTLREDLDLFTDESTDGIPVTEKRYAGKQAAGKRVPGPGERQSKLLPAARGKYTFFDMCDYTGKSTGALTEALWKEVWEGLLTCDSFEAVRRGIAAGFKPAELDETAGTRSSLRQGHPLRSGYRTPSVSGKRAGRARWSGTRPLQGNWFQLPSPQLPADALEELELNKARVRQLLARYGILFKELCDRELPFVRWSHIFKALRIMELSGEIAGGKFLQGVSGLQFALPDAVKTIRNGLEEDVVYWMNACDPASPCGLGIDMYDGFLPTRLPSNHLVFHGSRLVLISQKHGKEITVLTEPDSTLSSGYYGLFRFMLANRDRSASPRIKIELINGVPARDSVYAGSLKRVGFDADYKGLILRE
jgi:ATP-dependent Lhr-like helicase